MKFSQVLSALEKHDKQAAKLYNNSDYYSLAKHPIMPPTIPSPFQFLSEEGYYFSVATDEDLPSFVYNSKEGSHDNSIGMFMMRTTADLVRNIIDAADLHCHNLLQDHYMYQKRENVQFDIVAIMDLFLEQFEKYGESGRGHIKTGMNGWGFSFDDETAFCSAKKGIYTTVKTADGTMLHLLHDRCGAIIYATSQKSTIVNYSVDVAIIKNLWNVLWEEETLETK